MRGGEERAEGERGEVVSDVCGVGFESDGELVVLDFDGEEVLEDLRLKGEAILRRR